MRCPLPVRRQPLHRRTNLLRRPRLTTPPLRNRKRPAPDALPPPTKIGRGKRSPWYYRPVQTHSAARGENFPTPPR